MNEQEKNQKMALFKYSLIAAAVSGTFEAPSLIQHFRNVAEKSYQSPTGETVKVSFHTLERWDYKYKRYGIDALEPKKRSDTGKPRALPDTAIDEIFVLKEKFPYITGKAIYKKLVKNGFLNAVDTSLSTVHRFLRDNGLKSSPTSDMVVKAFEMEFANECWQCDYPVFPVIPIFS